MPHLRRSTTEARKERGHLTGRAERGSHEGGGSVVSGHTDKLRSKEEAGRRTNEMQGS